MNLKMWIIKIILALAVVTLLLVGVYIVGKELDEERKNGKRN